MNKHILIAMDYKNRSREELRENYHDAAAAADAAYAADAYAAADADAAAAAYHAAYHAADADAAAEYWITRYFEVTGENREDYEKALEEMKK